MNHKIKQEITNLVETAKTIYVSSIDKYGYPNTKAMFAMQNDGAFTHYLSTNTSSRRVGQFKKNSNACLYFCDESKTMGLMLVGNMEICTDPEHKTMLWREGFEMYYPNGIHDEDYCVLKFTAKKGNYYHGLKKIDFTQEDFNNA